MRCIHQAKYNPFTCVPVCGHAWNPRRQALYVAISKLGLRRAIRQPEPPRFVDDSPGSDWIEVLTHLRQAEDAVLAYAKRGDLPAGIAGQMANAAEQIRVGRWHDLMRLCRTPVSGPNYKPCCSHVADALAACEPVTTQS